MDIFLVKCCEQTRILIEDHIEMNYFNRFFFMEARFCLRIKIKKAIETLFFIISNSDPPPLHLQVYNSQCGLVFAYKTHQCDIEICMYRVLQHLTLLTCSGFYSIIAGFIQTHLSTRNTHEWLWAGFNLSRRAAPGEGCRWLRPHGASANSTALPNTPNLEQHHSSTELCAFQ